MRSRQIRSLVVSLSILISCVASSSFALSRDVNPRGPDTPVFERIVRTVRKLIIRTFDEFSVPKP